MSFTPTQSLVSRHVHPIVLEALSASRAVALLGARQVGKSTLALEIARSAHPAEYISLDDPAAAQAARSEPVEMIANLRGPAVIDEIQRAPDLLLAIKQKLDRDDSRGQFLLTGSADLLTLPTIADALPGRVQYLRLWPFSQAELSGVSSSFVDAAFAGRLPQVADSPVGRRAIAPILLKGGYPEAQGLTPRGLGRFFESYVESLLGRDLDDVAEVREPANVSNVLQMIGARSGAILSINGLAVDLGISRPTVERYVEILERLFIVRRIRAWHRNLGAKLVKSPKAYVVDSGLLAQLIGADEDRIADDGAVAGAMLESFVAMELIRLAELSDRPPSIHHFRDRRQREVDVVLERRSGEIVGIEVKAGASLDAGDFAGLRLLRDSLGERFKAGAVLYTGAQTLPFGDRLAAVPVSALWS
ncbi:MAG: ATP-binding protein [Solirubrobacterales bacterium]